MSAMDRFGWSLLHFLWQGTIIVALYAAARRTARGCSPNLRYILACGALAVMAVAPIATWFVLAPGPTLPVTAGHAVAPAVGASAGGFASTVAVVGFAPQQRYLPWVVAIWFAGALAFWIRLLGGWIFTVRLRTALASPAPERWQQTLERLKARLRVTAPVRLLTSALVATPVVVGWLRPVVLVPASALTGLPPEQIEALLIHELAHIRRADYFVNLLQGMVESLLFYHPAVWWISGQIRIEREMCCDDVAVSMCGDALTYVSALAQLESARPAHLRTAIAANGGSLADRIARLLGASRATTRTSAGPGIAAGAMLLAITAIAVFAQPAARSKFEVASIKPSVETGFQRVRTPPGRLSAVATVRLMMQNAYALQSFQIVNAPEWAASERYEVEAKANSDVGRAQIFLMLQSLLEDRFHLKAHRETRELPVYALVPSKGGVKLPSPKEGSCVAGDPSPNWVGGRIAVPGGPATVLPCGGVVVTMETSSGALLHGGRVLMPELIRTLSLVLGRVVIDKTGVTDAFDLRLEFLPDATSSALPPPPPGAPFDPNVPSILAAVQEQLGLKLESAHGPVDVLVIDHVERPAAN
jgi:uncharacterized protein (TIGR03435 family)